MSDILDELKQKMLNSNAPSWANRAADEIVRLRAELVAAELKICQLEEEKEDLRRAGTWGMDR